MSATESGSYRVELLVVSDGEQQVSRCDPALLVVPRRVTSQLQQLGCNVEEGSQLKGLNTGSSTITQTTGK